MNYFQMGAAKHQSGDLISARAFYLQHLSTNPADWNAYQLLGLAELSLGQLQSSIKNLTRSLSFNPNQPHVYNNLGVAQKKLQDFDASRVSFLKAIKQQPNYLDARKNLVGLELLLKNTAAAKIAIDQAKLHSDNAPMFVKLEADLCQQNEDYPAAIELLKKLVHDGHASAEIRHSLALCLRLKGQPKDALMLYNQLENEGVEKFQLFHNKANALGDLNRLNEAIDYYQKAISLNPAYIPSHENLNELLWETDDQELLFASYQKGFESSPDELELRFSYMRGLIKTSQFDAAVAFSEALTERAKQSFNFFHLRAKALDGLSQAQHALEQHQIACRFKDASAEARLDFAQALIKSEQYSLADDQISLVLSLSPSNKHAWALRGIVWQLTGDVRASQLNDYDNLVREYTIRVPKGFESTDQFCQQLSNYLDELHTGQQQPLDQSLNGGTQTRGSLLSSEEPLIVALRSEFERCIETYIRDTRPLTGTLPIIQSSEGFAFSGSWSVKLKSQGFHSQHIHPMGWLSSAFYVSLPNVVDDEQQQQGWLTLGAPNFELKQKQIAAKTVKPVVGKLVLFQSYMWHGTAPFDSDQTRTVIAFDVEQRTQ